MRFACYAVLALQAAQLSQAVLLAEKSQQMQEVQLLAQLESSNEEIGSSSNTNLIEALNNVIG